MALVLLAGAAAGVAIWGSMGGDSAPGEAAKPEKSTVARRFMHTGTYGEASQLKDVLHIPGMVVDETEDVDLSGVPCRWVTLRNGAVYKLYSP